MKKKKNSSFVVIALLLIVTISIGYAALSTTLNINGTSTIKKQTWSVYFDTLTVQTKKPLLPCWKPSALRETPM